MRSTANNRDAIRHFRVPFEISPDAGIVFVITQVLPQIAGLLPWCLAGALQAT
jgi:hypothetical protein